MNQLEKKLREALRGESMNQLEKKLQEALRVLEASTLPHHFAVLRGSLNPVRLDSECQLDVLDLVHGTESQVAGVAEKLVRDGAAEATLVAVVLVPVKRWKRNVEEVKL